MTELLTKTQHFIKRFDEGPQKDNFGKLKIYLGAAPGVGKTYKLLQDAYNKRKEGIDVVIGMIYSYDRPEIEELLTHFEILPLEQVEYHGTTKAEFNLSAAINRRPQLILIDNMAHSNAPGLRHAKRWQHIKELLHYGIDVNTTLNVQNIDSLNDTVNQILHAHIHETVPDTILKIAQTIELVDLPQDDLIKRFHEGKIHFSEQIDLRAQDFFRQGNLSSLRELALRVTAEHVGEELIRYRQKLGITYVWPTEEKILVCIGPDNNAAKLIKTARRMASALQAEWFVIYIDRPTRKISLEQRSGVQQNILLAEQLGAKTKIITGGPLVKETMQFAHEHNITTIMIGRKIRPRWKEILFKSTSYELERQSGEIDVHIIHYF
jgi:two-component system, OmpR family, sensor histidine kinase KdpD